MKVELVVAVDLVVMVAFSVGTFKHLHYSISMPRCLGSVEQYSRVVQLGFTGECRRCTTIGIFVIVCYSQVPNDYHNETMLDAILEWGLCTPNWTICLFVIRLKF